MNLSHLEAHIKCVRGYGGTAITIKISDVQRMIERFRQHPEPEDFANLLLIPTRPEIEKLVGKRLFRRGFGGGYYVGGVKDCPNPHTGEPSYLVIVKHDTYDSCEATPIHFAQAYMVEK